MEAAQCYGSRHKWHAGQHIGPKGSRRVAGNEIGTRQFHDGVYRPFRNAVQLVHVWWTGRRVDTVEG
eukprot:6210723-Pleurochrysis_carterae.AAC.2